MGRFVSRVFGARSRRSRLLVASALVGIVFAPGQAWSVPTLWQVAAQGGSPLQGVSCVSANFCAAIGGATSSNTVIEMWDGTAWTHVTNVAPSEVWLSGVSCVGTTFCVAAGYTRPGTIRQTYIDVWNGSTWSGVPSPDRGARDSTLMAVSCVSTTSCVAVGRYFRAPHQRTLIEAWDGVSWSIATSPSEPGHDDVLYGVSCSTAASCVAVGSSLSSSGVRRPLVETWDGATWSIIRTPHLAHPANFVGVSCVSLTSCAAVGLISLTDSTFATLAEFWDGANWTQTRTPNPGTTENDLFSVSCTTGTNCVAVGGYVNNANSKDRTLILNWDGTRWSRATRFPNAHLLGVSCVDDDTCYAVGSSGLAALVLAGA
jgi:hypothetical protein